MIEKKSSHIAIIDEEWNIYFDNNLKLKWLSLVWWSLEKWESHKQWVLREVWEETWIVDKITEELIIFIENNQEIVNNILWLWEFYWLKITKTRWDKIIEEKNNIRRVNYSELEDCPISEKLNKESIIKRINLVIDYYNENEHGILT